MNKYEIIAVDIREDILKGYISQMKNYLLKKKFAVNIMLVK